MNLADVMDEIASVLADITGLQVHAYPPATVTGPAGYVSYPQSIDYDQTYQRGCDRFVQIPVMLLAGEPTARASRDRIGEWTAGDGALSVKRRFEDHGWLSCDDAQITSAEFDVEVIAGVQYLGVMFQVDVVGQGA